MKTVDEVINYFNTDSERGLTPDQVKKYQEKYGPNGKSHISFSLQILETSRQNIYLLQLQVLIFFVSTLYPWILYK